MRTTLTLDDDVASLLAKEVRRSGVSFKAAVNQFLRMGLMRTGQATDGKFAAADCLVRAAQGLAKQLGASRDKAGDNLILVDDQGEKFMNVAGKVGFRFFGELILDCLHRTEKAMTQAHAFKAAELCLLAQAAAKKIE